MTWLEVPRAAHVALAQWDAGTPVPWVEEGDRNRVIREIAAPVVVAELRRLANELNATGHARVGRHVRSRADQLDGGAS